jgi:hypothetical protein
VLKNQGIVTEEYFMASEAPPRMQIIVALIGLLGVVLAAIIVSYWGGSKNINSPSPTPNGSNTPSANSTATVTPTLSTVKPDKLIEIIREQQEKNVRLSYAEAASQNFSDLDLANFIKEKKPAKIAEELKRDNEFLDTVLAIKAMPATERQRLLERALTIYKPTWAQLGRIDPKGQTEAGQKAEKVIAETIVNLVRDLSKLTDADIRKLYT